MRRLLPLFSIWLCAPLACASTSADKNTAFTINDEVWAEGTASEVRLKVLTNTVTGEYTKVIISPGGRVEELRLGDSSTGHLRDVLQGHSRNASSVWANLHWRGAILAPFANRIANGSYSFDGTTYYMPRNEEPARECALHGFLYNKSLTTGSKSSTSADGAVLILSHTFGTDPGYPFRVSISIQYSLKWRVKTGASEAAPHSELQIDVSATNIAGDGLEAPFFFGMHPYFKVSDVSKSHVVMDRSCAEYLHVDMPAGAPRKGTLIPTLHSTPWEAFNGTDMIGGTFDKPTYYDDEFKAAEFKHCTDGVAMRTLIKDDSGGAVLWQDDKFAYNQIFTGSRETWGDNAIAFEPMSAKADAFNNHDGLTVLSDGETWKGRFGIYSTSNL